MMLAELLSHLDQLSASHAIDKETRDAVRIGASAIRHTMKMYDFPQQHFSQDLEREFKYQEEQQAQGK